MLISKRDYILGAISALGGMLVAEHIWPTINGVVNNPSLDKQAAVAQMAAQIADNAGYVNTQGFRALANVNPWLEETRKSVGLLTTNGTPLGSAVVFDNQGTIVLCGHQFTEAPTKLDFYLSEKRGATCAPYDFCHDDKHDIMFASISKVDGISPVQLGMMGFDDSEAGRDVIAVGWPTPSLRLHATQGKTSRFEPNIALTSGKTYSCKMESNAVAFGGMSGGAVYSDGKLVGIVNLGNGQGINAASDFTPIDLIRAAYLALYPDRARRAGITMPRQSSRSPQIPDVCRINRRNFLSVAHK